MEKYEPKIHGQRNVSVTVLHIDHTAIEQEMVKTTWTLNSWNSSFSPQSVTLAPHVVYWATDFMPCTWIRFISLLEGSLASLGDLEQGLVHSFHPLILRSHLILTFRLSDLSPLWQPFVLPAPCSFISYLPSLTPIPISKFPKHFLFSEKSTVGDVAVNDGQALRLATRRDTNWPSMKRV